MSAMNEKYLSMASDLRAISEDVHYEVSILSNASALIWNALDGLNWCGFYLAVDNKLILGPFQGKIACTEIEFGNGVCGTAYVRNDTVLVEDVHQFSGHIACDSASNSEIVVPVHKNGEIFGVLDIDSPLLARFDREDQEGLELVVKTLEKILSETD